MIWIDASGSSNISRFGYDAGRRLLRVDFLNGTTYDYFDVPEYVFDGMKRATSRGGYLAQQVKGRFRYARA